MRAFRLAERLWERLGETAKRAGSNRGAVLRALVRWYLREPGAELPERPERD